MSHLLAGSRGCVALLFGCACIVGMWRLLGLSQVITDVMQLDISSSVTLEHILRLPESCMPNLPRVGLKEGIGATCCTSSGYDNNKSIMIRLCLLLGELWLS